MMRRATLIILGIAFLLGSSAYLIADHPQWITQFYSKLVEKCDHDSRVCLSLIAPFRSFADTEYKIRRSQVSKQVLPIIRIYMTDGALQKINRKRMDTLAEKKPILLATGNDWVKATLVIDDGEQQRKVKSKLRLKGDWADHIDTQKLSFRIKVRNRDHVFGMSKFSIQAPLTRLYQHEPMMLEMMRRVGVLAPRYFFVDVRLNGKKIGIMALEEHFNKEMVESQGRREGPIVAVDEDALWQQRHLNFNRSQVDFETRDLSRARVHYRYRDYPVKSYQSGSFEPGEYRSQQVMRAMSRFRDVMDDKARGVDSYDMDTLARWWVLVNIWNAKHGTIGHNRRFYFNPLTGKLEPVAFDNHAHPDGFIGNLGDFAIRSVINSREFKVAAIDALEVITGLLTSEKYTKAFHRIQKEYMEILEIDGDRPKPVNIEDLKFNLASLISDMAALLSTIQSVPQTGNGKNIRLDDDPIINTALSSLDTPLFTHIRAFWFWLSDGRTEIEIKNVTSDSISVEALFSKKYPEHNLLSAPNTLDVYQLGKRQHIFEYVIADSGVDINDEMLIRYRYRNKLYTEPLVLQFRNYDDEYIREVSAFEYLQSRGVLIDNSNKRLTFPAGHYIFNDSIEIDKGWRVVFRAGVDIELLEGSVLKINGPVFALGQQDLPVKIAIHSSNDRGLLGRWGGLFVQQAGALSQLHHIQFTGDPSSVLAGRQDSLGLTGCVTFYQSDVEIEDARFDTLQCEDALNIVSSNFTLNRVTINDAGADAFDSDFSTGEISESLFLRSGNDGVDLSGSQLVIKNTTFESIRDKAISVGEKSMLTADSIDINGALSGVVSKDNSIATVRDSRLRHIEGSALFAYVKKKEYGKSEIHCRHCEFEDVESVATKQFSCRITIDGKESVTTQFSRKQLHAAGYIK